ncbi:MAG TPA: glycerol-3-phosphate 1-O-acyltransferase PlsY [Gemmatimonadales bacterium]|jgi:glycerol-3-phosphate acyltransferase PlsY|nr:glycerol-3-phosphate 1-O-acyltransferase PlsY [Gemmatimonadales bacterium]
MSVSRLLIAIVAAYLLGSIPTSYWVVRLVKGVDLRTLGSGNLGATNLYRVLGWRFAVPVAAFDTLKGAVPVAVFGPWAGASIAISVALGVVALFGHVCSVFVGFRGGKGVATGAGIVLGVAPWAFLAVLGVWGVTTGLTGYVSLASVIAALALAPAIWFLEPMRRDVVGWFAALAVVVIWLHRANIKRLARGTENRFGRSRGAAA